MAAPTPSDGGYFCCGSCRLTFPSGWEARDEHCAAKGHEKPSNECKRCPLWFETQAAADEHMAAANHWPYGCRCCPGSFQTEAQCDEHETQHQVDEHSGHPVTPTGDIQKGNSETQHGNGQQLASVRVVDWLPAVPSTAANKPGRVQCHDCDLSFANIEALRDHGRASHGNRFTCYQCNKGFEMRGALNQHFRETREHGVDCPYCQTRFGAASILCAHLESGECAGKGETARHLDYCGLYQSIRFKDPYENFTTDFPNWTGEILTGKSRLYFYHCPNTSCRRKFKSLQGVMSHLEVGTCKFATKEDVFYNICPDIIHGFKLLGLYSMKGRKGTDNRKKGRKGTKI